MERYQRGKGKKRLLGSHQKCWIWGRNAVLETVEAGRWPVMELWLSEALPPELLDRAQAAARKQNIEPGIVPPEELIQRCHTAEHQGFLAKMSEFPYLDGAALDQIMGKKVPFIVILDGIQDPYNFGAILRSSEVFGADAVILAEHKQVGVTSMVARSSAGAVNRIPIIRVPEMGPVLHQLIRRGIGVIGTDAEAAQTIDQCDFKVPTAVVIGNEGQGLSDAVEILCTGKVRIPQEGAIGSLNAAVAASIFFYEISRQRRCGG